MAQVDFLAGLHFWTVCAFAFARAESAWDYGLGSLKGFSFDADKSLQYELGFLTYASR